MELCKNCNYKIKEGIKFCPKCGMKIYINEKTKKEKSNTEKNKTKYQSTFTYNGVYIDLKKITSKHEKNRVGAIKELTEITGLKPIESKKIIDKFYLGTLDASKDIKYKKDYSKLLLEIYTWIFFFPIMAIKLVVNNYKFKIIIKSALIILILVASIPYVIIVISIVAVVPMVIIILMIPIIVGKYGYLYELRIIKKELLEEEKKYLEKIEKLISILKKGVRVKTTEKSLDFIFSDNEMRNRLERFIIEYTKKYDYGEIKLVEYLERLEMLQTYINSKIDMELIILQNEEYWIDKDDLNINKYILKKYIKSKKQKIYLDEMKYIININANKKVEDIVEEYINIFGDNALMGFNIKIMSKLISEDYERTHDLVKKEYEKVKKEYQMRKLEDVLFRSSTKFRDMKHVDSLSGFEFEDYLEELFTEFGYKVKELPYSNDYGADLIISKGFNEVVIQAKNYSGSVGNKAVQEVIAAKSHYKSDIGMVITNAYYTPNAIKTAAVSHIILIDRDGLERLIDEGSIYFNSLIS